MARVSSVLLSPEAAQAQQGSASARSGAFPLHLPLASLSASKTDAMTYTLANPAFTTTAVPFLPRLAEGNAPTRTQPMHQTRTTRPGKSSHVAILHDGRMSAVDLGDANRHGCPLPSPPPPPPLQCRCVVTRAVQSKSPPAVVVGFHPGRRPYDSSRECGSECRCSADVRFAGDGFGEKTHSSHCRLEEKRVRACAAARPKYGEEKIASRPRGYAAPPAPPAWRGRRWGTRTRSITNARPEKASASTSTPRAETTTSGRTQLTLGVQSNASSINTINEYHKYANTYIAALVPCKTTKYNK